MRGLKDGSLKSFNLLAVSRLNGNLEHGAQDLSLPPGLLKSEKTLAPF
jgi:hypothetical protein